MQAFYQGTTGLPDTRCHQEDYKCCAGSLGVCRVCCHGCIACHLTRCADQLCLKFLHCQTKLSCRACHCLKDYIRLSKTTRTSSPCKSWQCSCNHAEKGISSMSFMSTMMTQLQTWTARLTVAKNPSVGNGVGSFGSILHLWFLQRWKLVHGFSATELMQCSCVELKG